MTDNEMRVKLARLEGVVRCSYDISVWFERDGVRTTELPDYLNDHNAIHAVLVKLSDVEFLRSIVELAVILGFDEFRDDGDFAAADCQRALIGVVAVRAMLTATPAQMCEALLRAIGEWND